jgi:hypothetical protein
MFNNSSLIVRFSRLLSQGESEFGGFIIAAIEYMFYNNYPLPLQDMEALICTAGDPHVFIRITISASTPWKN